MCTLFGGFFFFFKQKTAYEMRISDWSSDVCSSDLALNRLAFQRMDKDSNIVLIGPMGAGKSALGRRIASHFGLHFVDTDALIEQRTGTSIRSEEHTSELQSLMRISYAVFCLKKKHKKNTTSTNKNTNKRALNPNSNSNSN